jgi:hypothetical protein
MVVGMTTFLGLGACVSTPKTYSLATPPTMAGDRMADSGGGETTGQLSVEATRSGQRVVVVQLSELPPPERIASGLTEFVVWIEDGHGRRVKAGTLRYDRARHAGNLLATTDLSAFTVQITGERSEDVSAPSNVLVAERRVSPN